MAADPIPRVTVGVSRVSLHAAADDTAMRVDRISYAPGAHTHWHLHTGEQILYGERGSGWITFTGRSRTLITPGVVVHVPIGISHWHGARPHDAFEHLAVTSGGDTVWLGAVTDDEYAAD